MKKLILLFYIQFLIIQCSSAQITEGTWPYQKSVEYVYISSDSTGKNLIGIARKVISTYDTSGRILSNYYEVNKSSNDTPELRPTFTDTIEYDNFGRVKNELQYGYNGNFFFANKKIYEYYDSTNSNGYILTDNNKAGWQLNYKNKNGFDSAIIKGEGNVFNQNYTKADYFLYKNNLLDSHFIFNYNKDSLKWIKAPYFYTYEYQGNGISVRNWFGQKNNLMSTTIYTHDPNSGKLKTEEIIFKDGSKVKSNYYYFNNLLIEKRKYNFDKVNNAYLISTIETYTYNSNGAVTKYLLKVYNNGGFAYSNTHLYYYDLRVPTASFESSNTCNNDTILFINKSKEAQRYRWYFGDGNFSIEADPIHIYKAAGTYIVSLKATSNSGKTDSVTQKVTVYPIPKSNFKVTRDTFKLNTESYVFTPEDTSQHSYHWYIGDSTIKNTNKILRYSFKESGNHKVSLKVVNNYNCSSKSDSILSIVAAILEPDNNITSLKLYPNPNSGLSFIEFTLKESSTVNIIISNLAGKEISRFTKTYLNTGKHSIKLNLNAFNCPKGIYLIKFLYGKNMLIKKLILI